MKKNLNSICHSCESGNPAGNKDLYTAEYPVKRGMTRKCVITALTLTLGLALASPALAASCANGAGQTVTGVDGKTYCRSVISMNWWSAFAWCEAAGMTLVSLEDCNGQNGNISGETQCPNFTGVGPSNSYWTSSVPSASYAYYVNLSSGAVNGLDSRGSSYYFALCK